MSFIILLSGLLFLPQVQASEFPRVDQDIKTYDDHVARLKLAFKKIPTNPQDKVWVKKKLAHMFDVDQYMRKYSSTPQDHKYSAAETKEFYKQMEIRWKAVDSKNTADLKKLLKIYRWFKISEFGADADQHAWILVQHADGEPAFQQSILTILTDLWPKGETSPANYAYLFDRVAASFSDKSKRKLQRYGSQGDCIGRGKWEPLPMEDPAHIDDRRATVGLGTMADYIKLVQGYCY